MVVESDWMESKELFLLEALEPCLGPIMPQDMVVGSWGQGLW